MRPNVQKIKQDDSKTVNYVSDLVFGVNIKKWGSLPLPGTDAEVLIMNEDQLTQYQAWYGQNRVYRRGDSWVVPSFEKSRKRAINRKAATLLKWNTTE